MLKSGVLRVNALEVSSWQTLECGTYEGHAFRINSSLGSLSSLHAIETPNLKNIQSLSTREALSLKIHQESAPPNDSEFAMYQESVTARDSGIQKSKLESEKYSKSVLARDLSGSIQSLLSFKTRSPESTKSLALQETLSPQSLQISDPRLDSKATLGILSTCATYSFICRAREC